MNHSCYNSRAAEIHAHEEGILAGREMYLESLREEVESRLNDGDSICLGAYSYNKREILSEGLGAEGELLLAELHTLGTEAAAKALREHLETVLAQWIKDNIDDIAMVEYGVAA